jgi:hypothetical protein
MLTTANVRALTQLAKFIFQSSQPVEITYYSGKKGLTLV